MMSAETPLRPLSKSFPGNWLLLVTPTAPEAAFISWKCTLNAIRRRQLSLTQVPKHQTVSAH
jgi:hypothetical protein